MPPITVSPGDFLVIGTLVLLEGLLSADNALVLAILVKHLPKHEQKRALLYGLVGAFALRAVAIFSARYLMGVWWLCGVGACYLLWLAGHHFVATDEPGAKGKSVSGGRFWVTVAQVEFTDLVFAVDSILVAVALVHRPEKIWVVYIGGFMGIFLLRLAASYLIRLITRYPALDHMAYGLVGWAGIKLASTAMDIRADSLGLPEPHFLPQWAFWAGFSLIGLAGSFYATRAGQASPNSKQRDGVSTPADSGGLSATATVTIPHPVIPIRRNRDPSLRNRPTMFVLRPATPLDADKLSPVATTTFADGWADIIGVTIAEGYAQKHLTPERLRSEIADTGVAVFLLAINAATSAIIGYAKLDTGRAAHESVTGQAPVLLQRLYVAEAGRGTGVADLLLAEIEGEAAARGFRTLWLECDPHNRRAWAFYEKRGFAARAPSPYHYPGGVNENVRVMERAIS